MNSSDLTHSTRRPARRLTTALLATTALALFPAAVRAEAPASQQSGSAQPSAAGYSYAEEYKVERTCNDWERVRRCADPAGQVQYECASKGPFAKFWASLRGRSQDDEVRVKVIRKAPAGSTSSVSEGEAAPAQKQVSSTQEARTQRVVTVKKGTLPACQDHH